MAAQANLPATGTLTIERATDDPLVTERLHPTRATSLLPGQALVVKGGATASDGGTIGDPDGLTAPALRYQWFRHLRAGDPEGEPIPGATGERYVLTAQDIKRRISVRVDFRDDQGHAESLRSRLTPFETRIERPLTVEALSLPGSHDGGRFSFELRFSGDVTIRNGGLREALEVRGGEVVRVRWVAYRADWRRITVRPYATVDVSIALPAGEPCETDGEVTGICSRGGQRLRNELALTVTGADGPAIVPFAPGPPRSQPNLDSHTVTISWQPLVFDGGKRLQWYQLAWKPAEAGWDDDHGSHGTRPPLTAVVFTLAPEFPDDTGAHERILVYGSTYTLRVRAKNSLGWGPWSEDVEISVPGQDDFATHPSAPQELAGAFDEVYAPVDPQLAAARRRRWERRRELPPALPAPVGRLGDRSGAQDREHLPNSQIDQGLLRDTGGDVRVPFAGAEHTRQWTVDRRSAVYRSGRGGLRAVGPGPVQR